MLVEMLLSRILGQVSAGIIMFISCCAVHPSFRLVNFCLEWCLVVWARLQGPDVEAFPTDLR